MIEVRSNAPTLDHVVIRRALISVYDKTGLNRFASGLNRLGISIVSSGGTAKHLRRGGFHVETVPSITGFPEILGGRVKTLHPKIYGGLLSRREDRQDSEELIEHGISPIDMVVVNLYPFEEAVSRSEISDALAAENIDIGGPAMLRAAAKNFAYVVAVTSPGDYDAVLRELHQSDGSLSRNTRYALAASAFARTSQYDMAIAAYLQKSLQDRMPKSFAVSMPRDRILRYGENPHQAAAFYGNMKDAFEQLHGKPLSYNNLLDTDAALALIAEFEHADPTVAILKHTNPCGVATAGSLETAHERALATDTRSPFGGIVVMNRPCSLAVAKAINKIFTEIIIAPEFEEEALSFLKKKKNRRLLLNSHMSVRRLEARTLLNGVLCQEHEPTLPSDYISTLKTVTSSAPSEAQLSDLDFAWRVAKHVKSNAIVYAGDQRTLGIGAGQMSRVDASELAVRKAQQSGLSLENSVVASDAFFPFADGLEAAAQAGARAVIQPGGSVRDEEVIAAADQNNVAMVFTERRHFRH